MTVSETLNASIERITFRREETGYSVLRLRVKGVSGEVTAVGNVGPVAVGQGVTLTGCWVRHPEFGRQFQFEHYEIRRPTTADAIEKYLAGGAIPGIGPHTAHQLVEKFGAETLLA